MERDSNGVPATTTRMIGFRIPGEMYEGKPITRIERVSHEVADYLVSLGVAIEQQVGR